MADREDVNKEEGDLANRTKEQAQKLGDGIKEGVGRRPFLSALAGGAGLAIVGDAALNEGRGRRAASGTISREYDRWRDGETGITAEMISDFNSDAETALANVEGDLNDDIDEALDTEVGELPRQPSTGDTFVDEKYLLIGLEQLEMDAGDSLATRTFASQDMNWSLISEEGYDSTLIDGDGPFYLAISSADNELDFSELNALANSYAEAGQVTEINDRQVDELVSRGSNYRDHIRQHQNPDELSGYSRLTNNLEDLEVVRDQASDVGGMFRGHEDFFQHVIETTPYDDGEPIGPYGDETVEINDEPSNNNVNSAYDNLDDLNQALEDEYGCDEVLSEDDLPPSFEEDELSYEITNDGSFVEMYLGDDNIAQTSTGC